MMSHRDMCAMSLVCCLFLVAGFSQAKEEYRVFKGADGRSIIGKLTEYHPGKQIVTIQRDDGRKFPVHLELFSVPDQLYIREQSAVTDFKSIRIMPVLRKLKPDERSVETNGRDGTIQTLGYVVTLKNHSWSLFERIEIEYGLFYRQGSRRGSILEFEHGVQCGGWTLELLEAGAEYVFRTKRVLIYNEESIYSLFGGSSPPWGQVDGIWLRMEATLPTGGRVIRELKPAYLSGEYHTWATASVPAGLNSH